MNNTEKFDSILRSFSEKDRFKIKLAKILAEHNFYSLNKDKSYLNSFEQIKYDALSIAVNEMEITNCDITIAIILYEYNTSDLLNYFFGREVTNIINSLGEWKKSKNWKVLVTKLCYSLVHLRNLVNQNAFSSSDLELIKDYYIFGDMVNFFPKKYIPIISNLIFELKIHTTKCNEINNKNKKNLLSLVNSPCPTCGSNPRMNSCFAGKCTDY